jgi:ubiquinone/menaquinone biosynthesis C-methylase UbiE
MRIADVRYPAQSQERGGERWSQWSSVPMIELSALSTVQFVTAMIPHPHQRILEVGCGNGYLSLELARAGHSVVGLDRSQEILAVAEQTRSAHPQPPGSGHLEYTHGAIEMWPGTENSFDIVVVNRALHHLQDLATALVSIRRLLVPAGLFICQDYAYDRLTPATADWAYGIQRLLFLSELSSENPATEPDNIISARAFAGAWREKAEQREHPLNRYAEMLQALQARFHQQHFSWTPYLFVYLGNSMRAVAPEQERALLTFLRDMEQHLIATERIQAVGFRYVGQAE